MTETATRSDDLAAVAHLLAALDICSFTTSSQDGALHGRPMSNNGQVEYDGDSWFFAREDSRKVIEIDADPHVALGFIDTPNGTWVNVEGEAEVIRDDIERKRQLWQEDLGRWFENGPDDPSVVLIKVRARHIDAWAQDQDYSIEM